MAIARKVVVSAHGEGIILHTAPSKTQRSSQQFLIKYADGAIAQLPRDNATGLTSSSPSFDAFGVIGMLRTPPLSSLPHALRFFSRRGSRP